MKHTVRQNAHIGAFCNTSVHVQHKHKLSQTDRNVYFIVRFMKGLMVNKP